MTPLVSIVVPMRNEIGAIEGLLSHLGGWRALGCEVVIVDGQSSDGSAEAARAAGFGVIDSAPGRARQMNEGARAALGSMLLFLHADTTLPPNALDEIARVRGDGIGWGRFDVRIAGKPFMLRLVAAMINVRSRLTGIATGDQAIFVARDLFKAVGGFPDQPLMEDIEISHRLRAHARPACLSARVTTSGRRWESRGVWRTILLMWRLRRAYWRGVPAEVLAQAYP